MGKRFRRAASMRSCISPRFTSRSPHSIFNWYEQDIWTEIAKNLDGKSLVMLAATSKWFHHIVMEDNVWKYACLRDLQVPDCGAMTYKWSRIYGSAFGGDHSYMFHQQEKHIDWMRIGAFCFESSVAFLMENLICPLKVPKGDTAQQMVDKYGSCLLHNIKSGIWIADMQLVRCPVCDLNTCDGTMQILDVRHLELFLTNGFKDGSWDYKLIASQDNRKNVGAASGGILDLKFLRDQSTSDIFNLKSWVGKPNDWQPKAMLTLHAVAVNTNLQENEGINIKYHAMTAGADGEVVSIRISQQLL